MVTESQFEDKGYDQDFLAIIIIKKTKPPNGFTATCHLLYDSLKVYFQTINSHFISKVYATGIDCMKREYQYWELKKNHIRL